MSNLLSVLVLFSGIVVGAQLEDVKVLDATPARDHVKIKFQLKGAKDSYFFVDITKSDSDAVEKLGQVTKKLVDGDFYRLDLNIKSFSASPSGSFYKSDGIIFTGSSIKK